jgi:hypothetical protein
MLDEIAHLRTSPLLLQLLTHYVNLAEPNRDAWQNRLMAMDGVEPSGITQFHGELLAFDWIELNGGQSDHLSPHALQTLYRVTAEGLRAYGLVTSAEAKVQELPVTEQQKPRRKFPRRKREKKPVTEHIKLA